MASMEMDSKSGTRMAACGLLSSHTVISSNRSIEWAGGIVDSAFVMVSQFDGSSPIKICVSKLIGVHS